MGFCAVDAAGMLVCERFTQQVVDGITTRLPNVPDAEISARVVCAVAVAGHRAAVDAWQSRTEAGPRIGDIPDARSSLWKLAGFTV